MRQEDHLIFPGGLPEKDLSANFVPMSVIFPQMAGAIADRTLTRKTNLSGQPLKKAMLAGIMISCPPTVWPIGFALVELELVTLSLPIARALNMAIKIWPSSIKLAPLIACFARTGIIAT